jgi:hypothetical protein
MIDGRSAGHFRRAGGGDQLRQPKIQNLHVPVFADEHVLRLQVAMDDAFLMRRSQAARNLAAVIDRFAQRQNPVAHRLPQCLSFQQF